MVTQYTNNSVKRRAVSVNRHDGPIARRFKPILREAANAQPLKVLAQRTGISADVIRDLREERRLPSLPTFVLLARHDPRFRAQAIAIMSGEGEAAAPENIHTLLRNLGWKP